MKLILASTSKFKNELLDTAGLTHSQIKSTFEEFSPHQDNVY